MLQAIERQRRDRHKFDLPGKRSHVASVGSGHEVLNSKASRALLPDNADAVFGVGIAMKTPKDAKLPPD